MTPVNFNQVLQDSSVPNTTSLDDSTRVKINHSLWQKITHFKEKSELDNKLYKEVFTFFKQRYGFQDDQSFKRVWDKLGAKVWTTDKDLTAGTLRHIDAKFRKELIYHGDGIHEPKNQVHLDATVQKLVQALLHGGEFSPRMVEERAAKAIFVTQDKELMKQFQQELQFELDNLAANPPKNEHEEVVWRAFLGNVIALMPFCYPSTGDVFSIPVLENGVCRKVNYDIEVIPLTYTKLSSPMVALGMTSKEDPSASPLLSFIGTTFPAGSGFTATLMADFTPANSVGQIIYKLNRKNIDGWLANKKNPHVFGMSLGGAMAFHTLRHNHQIARVDVYNPPGLYSGNWKKGVGATCDVNIYCQPGDIVSKMGAWPTGNNVSLYTVYSHQVGVSEDPISSHARAFTGCEKITVIKEDPKKENKSFGRYVLTKMHQFLGPFVVFLPVSCTLLLYKIANSVHRASSYCFKKISKTFAPKNKK